MDLAKELLDKMAESEDGCTHKDFEHGHPLSDESAFNAVLDIIRAGGADLLKETQPIDKVYNINKINESVKNNKPLSMDDIEDIEAV